MKRFALPLLTAATLTLTALVASAAEINGIKYDDTATVAGKSLVLNGLGIRYKVVKVYSVGLYLTEKKNHTADILAMTTPKRFRIVTIREMSSEEFGTAFLAGVNKNLDKDEKAKYVNQLVKFGELFNDIEASKKGDVILGDYIPGQGTQIYYNGKPLGQPLPDIGFYNAILRIWIGNNPADPTLKPLLLGEKPE